MKILRNLFMLILGMFLIVYMSWNYFFKNILLHNLHPQNLTINKLKSLEKVFNLKTPELADGSESKSRVPNHNIIYTTDEKSEDKMTEAKKHLFYAGQPGIKQVALTFDDGPDVYFTTKILDILNNNNIKATFFIVGTRAQSHPEMVKRIINEGHIIGNHTWDHSIISKLSPDDIRSEVVKADDILYNITGIHTALFRPPYGAATSQAIDEVTSMGYNIIDWSVDTRDWSGTPPYKIMEHVRNEMRPGGIILQHCAGGKGENLTNTIIALNHIISLLKAEGYSFVQIPELLDIPSYR